MQKPKKVENEVGVTNVRAHISAEKGFIGVEDKILVMMILNMALFQML
jgi:hypothetical protein